MKMSQLLFDRRGIVLRGVSLNAPRVLGISLAESLELRQLLVDLIQVHLQSLQLLAHCRERSRVNSFAG